MTKLRYDESSTLGVLNTRGKTKSIVFVTANAIEITPQGEPHQIIRVTRAQLERAIDLMRAYDMGHA